MYYKNEKENQKSIFLLNFFNIKISKNLHEQKFLRITFYTT